MRLPIIVLLVCSVLSSVAKPSEAADASWAQLYRDACTAERSGKAAVAIDLYRRSIDSAQAAQVEDLRIGVAWNQLGMIFLNGEKLQQALAAFQKAEQVFSQSGPLAARNYITVLGNLGVVYLRLQQYPQSIEYFERVLAADEAVHGPTDMAVLPDLRLLATVVVKTGNRARAEDLWRRVVSILERRRGIRGPSVAQALDQLSHLLEEEHRYADARSLRGRSANICESVYGPNDVNTINALFRLAQNRIHAAAAEEALAILTDALTRAQKRLGPQSADLVVLLDPCAHLLEAAGKRQPAIQVRHRLEQLRPLAVWQQRFAAARRIPCREKPAEAEASAKACLQESLVFGSNSQPQGLACLLLASCYQGQRKFREAEVWYGRALDIYRQVFGEAHPEVAAVLQGEGIMLAEAGNPARAVDLEEQALAANAAPGLTDISTQQAVTLALGQLHYQAAHFAPAIRYLRMYLDLSDRNDTPRDVVFAGTLNLLGIAYIKNHQGLQAVPFLQQAQTIWRSALPSDDQRLVVVAQNLAAAGGAELPRLPSVATFSHEPAGSTYSPPIRDWIFGLIGAVILAIQSGRRGYSRGVWFLASFASSIVLTMSVLAFLPDRRLDRKRRREAEILDDQLAKATRTGAAPLAVDNPVVVVGTLSSQVTQL